MRELHDLAVANNVILLNEVGLDPGIDHMLVMKAVDSVHSRGGKVGMYVYVYTSKYICIHIYNIYVCMYIYVCIYVYINNGNRSYARDEGCW
jgi:saccharopine dehydrogenase-like NADP-dependent oxidoreductase